MKRLKSDLKMIKSLKKDEMIEINRKIDAWQNTLHENIMNEKRVILFVVLFFTSIYKLWFFFRLMKKKLKPAVF